MRRRNYRSAVITETIHKHENEKLWSGSMLRDKHNSCQNETHEIASTRWLVFSWTVSFAWVHIILFVYYLCVLTTSWDKYGILRNNGWLNSKQTFARLAVSVEFKTNLALTVITAKSVDTNMLTSVVISLTLVMLYNRKQFIVLNINHK